MFRPTVAELAVPLLIESRMSAGTPVLRLTCPEGYELKPDDVRWSETQEWLDTHLKPLLEALPLTHVLSGSRLWPQR